MSGRVFLGVLELVLIVPGARSLKDRRQVVRSLVDRIRARFEVSARELAESESPTRTVVVVTTAGGEPQPVRSALEKVREFAESAGRGWIGDSTLDVFRWQPPVPSWYEPSEDGGRDDG